MSVLRPRVKRGCVLSFGTGWTMVFKVVNGVNSAYVGELWKSSSTHIENVTAALDTTATHQEHYKNRIVQNWKAFNPQEVTTPTYCTRRTLNLAEADLRRLLACEAFLELMFNQFLIFFCNLALIVIRLRNRRDMMFSNNERGLKLGLS